MTKPAGGLKLVVSGAGKEDRRVRFARVYVWQVDDERETELVADAQGRLGYRLLPAEYRLRLDEGGETSFAVGDAGWTTVRVRLPEGLGAARRASPCGERGSSAHAAERQSVGDSYPYP